MSNSTKATLHMRLAEIFGMRDKVMGGRNILFFGDLLQLSPVKNGPCFSDLGNEEKKILKGFSFVNIWDDVHQLHKFQLIPGIKLNDRAELSPIFNFWT